MPEYLDSALREIETLFHNSIHILGTGISEQTEENLQNQLTRLQKQSEDYKAFLSDQAEHSRSSLSRDMAALIMIEERKIENLLAEYFPDDPEKAADMISDEDYNVRALYEEYLTGRAMQSVREALIGAIKLRILSERSKQIKQ